MAMPLHPALTIFKPVFLLLVLLFLFIVFGIFLYVKYRQFTDFVNALDISKPVDGGNPNFTTPSRTEIKLNIFATCFLMQGSYENYISRMNLTGREKMLDFGSGAGPAAQFIAAKLEHGEGQLTCLDISQTWMKVIQARLAGRQGVQYVLGDVRNIDLQEDIFDIILIHFVLHDIDPEMRQQIINRLAALLKNGGRLFIREPRSDIHGMAGTEIRKLMRNARLKEIKMEPVRIMVLIPVNEGIYIK